MTEGKKFDTSKTRFDLIEPKFTEGIAKVLTYGADKYGAYNWVLVDNDTARYTAALHRHINAWEQEEDCDPESGMHHLLHAACNLMFLMRGQYEATDVSGFKSKRTIFDDITWTACPKGREVNPEQADLRTRDTKNHLDALVTLLDRGQSPERIRTCIDNLCSRRGVPRVFSSDNKTSDE
jgi:hypothetical protein